jgi:hypothetical protein
MKERNMHEKPVAQFHADAVDIHMTPDGAFALLTLVNQTQAQTVSLSRQALDEFLRRADDRVKQTPHTKIA